MLLITRKTLLGTVAKNRYPSPQGLSHEKLSRKRMSLELIEISIILILTVIIINSLYTTFHNISVILPHLQCTYTRPLCLLYYLPKGTVTTSTSATTTTTTTRLVYVHMSRIIPVLFSLISKGKKGGKGSCLSQFWILLIDIYCCYYMIMAVLLSVLPLLLWQ